MLYWSRSECSFIKKKKKEKKNTLRYLYVCTSRYLYIVYYFGIWWLVLGCILFMVFFPPQVFHCWQFLSASLQQTCAWDMPVAVFSSSPSTPAMCWWASTPSFSITPASSCLDTPSNISLPYRTKGSGDNNWYTIWLYFLERYNFRHNSRMWKKLVK